MTEYFYCYSTTLYHFLKASQQRYIVAGLHEKTLNKFWLFEKTPQLARLLDEYDERKVTALGNR
jgi:hypothetical protein